MSAGQPRKNSPNRKSKQPEPPPPSPSVMEALSRVWLRFERYSWDVLGVLLLAVSALTALALFGLTEGSFISPWGTFLKQWTGIGAYVIIIMMAQPLRVVARRRRNDGGPERASRTCFQ